MAACFNVEDDGALLTDINTTPLIDVLLVLLIVTILAIPALTHQTVLETSGGDRSKTAPPPRIEIEIEFDGSLYWNETSVRDFAQLESFLRTTANQSPQPEVVLNANKYARYDTVAKVLATAQRLGVRRLGFAGQERFAD